MVEAIASDGGVDPSRYAVSAMPMANGATPNMASLTGELFSGDADERFAFGLRLMIEGLRHVRARARPR